MLVIIIIQSLIFKLIALSKISLNLTFHCISLWNESLGWIDLLFLLQRETVRFRIREGFQYIPYLLVAVLLLKTIEYGIGSLIIGVIKYSIILVFIELLLSKYCWIGWYEWIPKLLFKLYPRGNKLINASTWDNTNCRILILIIILIPNIILNLLQDRFFIDVWLFNFELYASLIIGIQRIS